MNFHTNSSDVIFLKNIRYTNIITSPKQEFEVIIYKDLIFWSQTSYLALNLLKAVAKLAFPRLYRKVLMMWSTFSQTNSVNIRNCAESRNSHILSTPFGSFETRSLLKNREVDNFEYNAQKHKKIQTLKRIWSSNTYNL